MKNALIILVILLSAYASSAQQYVPMPTSNAAYQYRSHYGMNPIKVTDALLMIDGSDTTVHGKVYKKIMARCWDTVYTDYTHAFVNRIATRADYLYGLVREDNKKVYYIIYQHINLWGPDPDTVEHLQYDFNLGIGDTTPYHPRIITALDSIQVNGSYRKRYTVQSIAHPNNVRHLIEGVGVQEEGQLEIPHNNSFGLNTRFICLREGLNSNSFDTAGLCMHLWPSNTPVSVPETKEESSEPHIYPNPFVDELHISYDNGAKAMLYNSIGQVVVKTEMDHKKTTITTSSLSPGIYFLKIESKDGRLLKAQRLMK